jgi:lysyl-tRNA synthetase class II
MCSQTAASNKINHDIHDTECSTRYRTRHFFNNSNTNEDIATKFEQEYVRCVKKLTTSHVLEVDTICLQTSPGIAVDMTLSILFSNKCEQ